MKKKTWYMKPRITKKYIDNFSKLYSRGPMRIIFTFSKVPKNTSEESVDADPNKE